MRAARGRAPPLGPRPDPERPSGRARSASTSSPASTSTKTATSTELSPIRSSSTSWENARPAPGSRELASPTAPGSREVTNPTWEIWRSPCSRRSTRTPTASSLRPRWRPSSRRSHRRPSRAARHAAAVEPRQPAPAAPPLAPAPAALPPAPAPQTDYIGFEDLDLDNDGLVDREEAAKFFKAMEGELDKDEL